MSRQEWFRNEEWNSEVEQNFYSKLKKAKRKAQYLCIQAHHLSHSHPHIALRLLDEYFGLDDRFDDTRAFTFRADAYLALEQTEKAMDAYEHALAREKEFPNVRTESPIELPYLIATMRIRSRYERAMQLLEGTDTMLFPVQKFKYHAALALIAAELGRTEPAREHATEALREGERDHSGLRYHAKLGLVVDPKYETIILQLQRILDDGN
jgi:tetratricopeptide (TPR) repeat protein